MENRQGISFITPFKNRFNLFKETYQSLQSQSDDNWELIIVDDKSSEEEFQLLKSLVDPNIKVTLIKNTSLQLKGASFARNKGAKQANYPFIVFLDSDDVIGEDFVKTRLKNVKKEPEYNLWIYRAQVFHHQPGDSTLLWNDFTEEDDLDRFLNVDTPWHTTSTVWKKEFFQMVNGFDENCLSWQDWEIHVRALILSKNYKKYTTEIDLFYRKHEHAAISKKGLAKDHLKNRIYTVEVILQKLREANMLDNRKKYLLAKLLFSVQMNLWKSHEINGSAFKIIHKYNLLSKIELNLWKFYLRRLKVERTNPDYILKFIDKLYYMTRKEHFLDTKTSFLKIKI